jgi:hypothetical protein
VCERTVRKHTTLQNDEGAPLMCARDGVWQLAGVLSAHQCTIKHHRHALVYADVYAMRSWMAYTMFDRLS